MKYLLLVRVRPDADPTDAEADPTAWHSEGVRRGMYVQGHRLQETADATTVRVRAGRTLVTDGPFAEFKEQIAGVDLLEAPDLAAATALAERHPMARFGAIEVREVWAGFTHAHDTSVHPADSAGAMQYLLLHASVADAPAELPGFDSSPVKWIEEMEDRAVTRGSNRLRPPDEHTAATVRVRDGRTLATHGPYAEIHEQVAGYDLIEVADLDEAIEVAAKHPSAYLGAVEVRPLWVQ